MHLVCTADSGGHTGSTRSRPSATTPYLISPTGIEIRPWAYEFVNPWEVFVRPHFTNLPFVKF